MESVESSVCPSLIRKIGEHLTYTKPKNKHIKIDESEVHETEESQREVGTKGYVNVCHICFK